MVNWVDWSHLPYDLVLFIANKLHSVEDFLAFSAVCHSWRLVYLNKSWTPSRQVPWLMLDENHTSEFIRGFFNIYKNKMHKLRLPEAHDRRCWGSSHGWLITIGHDLEIRLLNPITQASINLPPQSTFENRISVKVDWYVFIHRATVFKIQDELVTMAIYGNHSLAFCRPGDSLWTTVQISTYFLFINVVCYRNQVFALSIMGTLVLVEIDGPDPPRAIYMASPPKDEKHWQQIYLVESSRDLLMVFCYEANSAYRHKLVKFRVYKFDFDSREWTILESLGDCVLYVDDSHCTSGHAWDDFECNSIYFAQDNLDWWLTHAQKFVGYYMGVYRMKDKSTEIFCLGEDPPSHYISPIWVTPTLW
uniref:KIB1-4 beta-propeller domain-containing protein n=1 Tax=Davidia involucrata TaxID=16924 RepID=A0A5B7BKM4_DAVIN